MTLRVVTPASGGPQIQISYAVGGQQSWPQMDMLTAAQVQNEITGSDGASTANA